jgi:hypothetical protein
MRSRSREEGFEGRDGWGGDDEVEVVVVVVGELQNKAGHNRTDVRWLLLPGGGDRVWTLGAVASRPDGNRRHGSERQRVQDPNKQREKLAE